MRDAPLRILALAAVTLGAAACGSAPGDPSGQGGGSGDTLSIGAIPDQDPEQLQRTYGTLADYLSEELDVEVEYVPVTDYTAAVTAFQRGDLQLAFFGGVTGVQARDQVEGAEPIAQRTIDAEFESVFVANTDTGLEPFDDPAGLAELAGHSFTFGSESSTSGRVMPQHFLSEAGVSVDEFAGEVGFSGSHDTTAKLVEEGTYEVGALNAALWDDRVEEGAVDTDRVREVYRTPTYHDYHWLARPELDGTFGAGFTDNLTEALLDLDGSDEREREILQLFQAEGFIATEAENYEQIEKVARDVGLL
ncbi:putative selenate ABC transporter substrate-binding protein [Haloechinothrix sp. YIM 98757]|uniref:Putative selenate ABC transporter substrate-binding protein n=1 Tax=Haloechinothrix aidingensis TaxID=2752311 RepID=A0A838A869_9PSEU|nr:putative selenate ABC transporter substrate-binding protein [Haloechinothrix aidingensis]MBA0124877.1 putative selenate ABC transporter substrate-binding protein [Haloechinothrix aidingensis]